VIFLAWFAGEKGRRSVGLSLKMYFCGALTKCIDMCVCGGGIDIDIDYRYRCVWIYGKSRIVLCRNNKQIQERLLAPFSMYFQCVLARAPGEKGEMSMLFILGIVKSFSMQVHDGWLCSRCVSLFWISVYSSEESDDHHLASAFS